ncbi:hypothetical protein PBI_COUNT_68 [Microbacterium phage Count]|nr:hypothetical protein PBI_COUNT_68 [Microbacterium phage Count]
MLSKFIAPVLGIVVTTSASIAFDGVAKQLVPSDLKAVPAFGIKIGVAVVGGLLAGRIAQIVVENVESVVETVTKENESEEVTSEEQEEN